MDTLTQLAPIIAIRPRNPKRLLITWHLGNVCNFSCTYCPKALHAGDLHWPSLEASKRFLQAVYEEYHGRRRASYIAYSFSGGEPTLCPHLPQIVKFIKDVDNKSYIHLISNGSRTLRYWDDISPLIQSAIITYHHQEADLDHTFEVATFLHGKKKLDRIHCNMDPEAWDKCYAAGKRFKDAGLPTLLKPLIKNFTDDIYDYTPDQLAAIRNESTKGILAWVDRGGGMQRSTVQQILVDSENRFQNWHCHAGLETLVVKSDGRVTTAECAVKELMNLNNLPERLLFPTEGHRCPVETCSCIVDISTTKRAPTK